MKLYAVIFESMHGPAISMFSLNYDKAIEWAEDSFARGAEEIRKIDPDLDTDFKWDVIEVPLDKKFFILPDKTNDIPPLDERMEAWRLECIKTYDESRGSMMTRWRRALNYAAMDKVLGRVFGWTGAFKKW